MANARFQRGRSYERRLMASLKGWECFHVTTGPVDVVAMRHGEVEVWQVKSGGRGPWEHFRPAEREALLQIAIRAGAQPLLAWFPADGRAMRVYGPDQWP